MQIPSYPDHKLEEFAEYFLGGLGTGLHDGKSLRIEAVIERHGLTIWPVKNLADVADAYVPLIPGIIFIDEAQHANASYRCRFTLSEELSHVLIHRELFAKMSPSQVRAAQAEITDQQYAQIEREAKHLAGALLMRRDWFSERYRAFEAAQRVRTSNDLEIASYVVRHASYCFNVSEHAAAVRARKLKLIDQEEMDDLGYSASK
jgi:Zn-dependent peptidase ImmA (M78 family)